MIHDFCGGLGEELLRTNFILVYELIDELNRNEGFTSLEFREKLARIAFTETAYYDSVISDYFNKKIQTCVNNITPKIHITPNYYLLCFIAYN